MATIREATKREYVLQEVMTFIRFGWPRKNLNPKVCQYANRQEALSTVDGRLMFAERVIVPEVLRQRVVRQCFRVNRSKPPAEYNFRDRVKMVYRNACKNVSKPAFNTSVVLLGSVEIPKSLSGKAFFEKIRPHLEEEIRHKSFDKEALSILLPTDLASLRAGLHDFQKVAENSPATLGVVYYINKMYRDTSDIVPNGTEDGLVQHIQLLQNIINERSS
ncbi:hypothetical protein CLF_112264 [Clonorchis sinensis]|uniref:Uncharacterized protein n=1 Tax=Clonorchis sinensis TaxID=79923 RepID=G7YW33_CLOSI|nr:hypothetical protein CLF_112264 [Clonorchis sinensis]